MPKYKSGLIRYIIKLMPGKEGQLRPAGLAQHWLKPGHSFEVFKENKTKKTFDYKFKACSIADKICR